MLTVLALFQRLLQRERAVAHTLSRHCCLLIEDLDFSAIGDIIIS